MTPSTKPSSNWLALQKSLVQRGRLRKRRETDRGESSASPADKASTSTSFLLQKRRESDDQNEDVDLETTEVKNGESIAALRRMVLGKTEYKAESQTAPGKYLALDCEMVGVGLDGNESSLARVSIVNYTGASILDVFVRQREKVVDYRTQWSGVRSADLGGSAKPFTEVQETVAELIKDRILVGHAVYNDLKALLLSHPSPQIRDTQSLAYKHRVVKSRRPALRVLVKQELGLVIQGGEHSSVMDARAAMALFRLYKKQWESGFRSLITPAHQPMKNKVDEDPLGKAVALGQPPPSSHLSFVHGRKRGHSDSESSKSDDDGIRELAAWSRSSRPRTSPPSPSVASHAPTQHRSLPSTGPTHPKGVSSGISTVISKPSGIKEIRRRGTRTGNVVVEDGVDGDGSKGWKQTSKSRNEWWKTLGGGKKGSTKL